MDLSHRVLQYWKDKSITFKYGIGISLMLFLIVVVSLTGYLSLLYVEKANHSIRINAEVEHLVLEMDRGMEKAWRLHRDFFLNYPLIGLKKAHENYAQPSIRQTSRVVTISKKLRKMIGQPDVGHALYKNNINLNLYLSSAERFAETSIESFELVTQISAPKSGLEARLDRNITELATELKRFEHYSQLLNEMKYYIYEYRIKRKRFLMQSAFNVAFRLRTQIQLGIFEKGKQKELIHRHLDQIQKIANEILIVDASIEAKFKDFVLQQKAADSVSESLIELAGKEVENSQLRIQKTYRLIPVILSIVTLVGLIAAVLIAYILNDHITRRIIRLTASAEKLRKGNLDVIAEDGAKDELGLLGRSFNYMAVRLKELINNLELKVEQRTEELTVSERRFRELFEHSNSGVAIYKPVDNGSDFVFKDINKAVEKIEGVRRSDVLGMKVTDVFPGIKELGLLDVFCRVAETGIPENQPVSFYADHKLQGWRENSVYKLPSGEIVSVYEDRTAEKKGEEEKRIMETQLERAKKMEAIGLLAGGVAHDLNNILAGIVGYPELLLTDLSEESELRAPLKAIHDSGQRAAAVVADLLTVARSVANIKKDSSLNDIVAEYMESPEFLNLISQNDRVDYSLELHNESYKIHCSAVHIKKCIMNLVTNAVEALEGTGRIRVATRCQDVDVDESIEKGIKAGKYIVLDVADNGPGIPAHNLGHIFEPFYTKKIMGKSGTGLGLAVVWNSMVDHNGTAVVESDDTGTLFSLYFPAVKSASADPDEAAPEFENLKGNGEKILIVDDERQLRELAEQILDWFGYDSTCVSSGEEAVEYLKENNADLVLLDMLMEPGINGCETYRRILENRPGQKAVLASGFSESEDVKKALQLGASEFILKPYSMEKLGHVVKLALG